MTQDVLKELMAAGQWMQVETAWTEAVEQGLPTEQLAPILEALLSAGQGEMAEVMGWTLLTDRLEKAAPEEALAAARLVAGALPDSESIRAEAAGIFRKHLGGREHFEAILKASGLTAGRSLRWAFRILDVCLNLRPGAFLSNRVDGHVVRVEAFDPAAGQYEISGARGARSSVDAHMLADDYDPVDDSDFRVLAQHGPDELRRLLEAKPAAVLIGICKARGGAIDAVELQDLLVPKYLAQDAWSDWWGKARTAAKRCHQLSIAGRPVEVSFHEQGMTLEEELAPAAKAAKMPLERLDLLRQYVRDARARKAAIRPDFAAVQIEALAEQARQFKENRPSDALAAALAVEAAVALGLPGPHAAYPSPPEVLAGAARPAVAVEHLAKTDLWSAGLAALRTRPDAPAQMVHLLPHTPAAHLDELAEALLQAGQAQPMSQAVTAALADPLGHLEMYVWLWQTPAVQPPNMPGKLELLSRLLKALQALDHNPDATPARKKAIRHRVRVALSAGDYASFKQAMTEMDDAVASTIRNQVEISVGLGQSVSEDIMAMLRESFYGIFAKARVENWLDETTIWTTEAAMTKRQEEMKYLEDVKMLENSRAIGAAAEHGDLSENSEWKFAIEERDLLLARIAKMRDELTRCRVIRYEDVPADIVGIGSKVRLKAVGGAGEEVELVFLGPWDSDIDHNIFAYRTGLGLSLMGKPLGATVQLKLGGEEKEYRIEGLTPAVADQHSKVR